MPDSGLPGETTPNPDQLASFVSALVRKRDKAITGRRSSGIESDWLEDEEYYQGIDDANRQFVRSWVATVKRGTPVNQTPDGSRSTVFLNITRPYVDAAAARLADMLLPVDDRCWAIKPTPIAELDPQTSAQLQTAGVNWQQIQAGIESQAKAAAELMGDEIDDHLVECNWHGEVRTVIEDAARIGCGVLKGPIPQKQTLKKWVDGTLQVVTEIKPGSVRIDPWNFYPDEACGENIHNGNGTWERGYITPKQLRDMATMPGYQMQTITEILLEGPKILTAREASDGTYVPTQGQYEMWTHYGVVAKDDAVNSGLNTNDQTPIANVMALLVNDKLIKISLNALDTGEYPYDVLAWQRRPGVPWGMGIARHIRTPQRMLNAAARAMMDNAGMTAKPQVVIGNGISPADGRLEVRGGKIWRAEPDMVLDVSKAFYCYVPDSHQAEFMAIIEFARSIAEQTTGMPMLLQGQQTQGQAADTLGGMQLLQNNATGVLRRLAKRFDDYLTEPHIRRYYNWLMQYSERDDIKGDFQIDVRASSALVERDATKQFFFAAMNFAKDPAFGIDPYKLFQKLAQSDRVDPKDIQIDEDQYRQSVSTPSAVDQAKIDLSKSQAGLTDAKATREKVTAQYEAIEGAEAVSTLPQIMPVADKLLESAGFQGAPQMPQPAAQPTAPSGVTVNPIKNHDTGIQFTPGNTHPNLPAPPPSPDVGAQAGIEGGQQ